MKRVITGWVSARQGLLVIGSLLLSILFASCHEQQGVDGPGAESTVDAAVTLTRLPDKGSPDEPIVLSKVSRCVADQAKVGDRFVPTGTLVFSRAEDPYHWLTTKSDIATGALLAVPDRDDVRRFSPDQTMLLHYDSQVDHPQLGFLNLSTNEDTYLPLPDEWPSVERVVLRWQSDSLIALNDGMAIWLMATNGEYRGVVRYPAFEDALDAGSGTQVSISPDTYHAVYLDRDQTAIIRSLQVDQTIERVPGLVFSGAMFPKWSMNGDSVLALSRSVDAQGDSQVSPIHVSVVYLGGDLATTHLVFPDEIKDFFPVMASWSPNERYFAMWAKLDPLSQTESDPDRVSLIALDLEHHLLLDYCYSIDVSQVPLGDSVSFSVLWSPSSDYVIVPARESEGMVFLEIETGINWSAPLGISAIAWSR